MGARQSAYLADDVHEPQPLGAAAGASFGGGQGYTGASEHGRAASATHGRPPPLTVPPAGPLYPGSNPTPTPGSARFRLPLCSAAGAIAVAADHPQSPASSPAGAGLVDVWIIAGQSNAVGDNAADGTPMPPAAAPLPGRILAFGSGAGAGAGAGGSRGGGGAGSGSGSGPGPGPVCWRWADAAPSVHLGVHGHDDQDSCGPDMAFARTLLSLGLSARVGLVPAAKGATNLFHDWRPGGGGGDLYGAMISRTKAAMAAPLPGGGTCRLRGMIWVQGEADAEEKVGPAPSAAYGANLAALLAALRRDLAAWHPQLPVLLGVMPLRKRGCFPHLPAVRSAQLSLSLPGLVKLDLAGFEFFEEYGGFHVHLTKDGACAAGAAMAHAYYAAVVGPGVAASAAAAAVAGGAGCQVAGAGTAGCGGEGPAPRAGGSGSAGAGVPASGGTASGDGGGGGDGSGSGDAGRGAGGLATPADERTDSMASGGAEASGGGSGAEGRDGGARDGSGEAGEAGREGAVGSEAGAGAGAGAEGAEAEAAPQPADNTPVVVTPGGAAPPTPVPSGLCQ